MISGIFEKYRPRWDERTGVTDRQTKGRTNRRYGQTDERHLQHSKVSRLVSRGGRGPGGGSPLAGVQGQSPRSLNGTPQRIIRLLTQCKFLQNTQYLGVIQTSPI